MSFFGSKIPIENGGGSVIIQIIDPLNEIEEFISNEGQTHFTPNKQYGRLVRVIVGGVEQFPSTNYKVEEDGSFTLKDNLKQGVKVVAIYRKKDV